jgi:hypothetical protein
MVRHFIFGFLLVFLKRDAKLRLIAEIRKPWPVFCLVLSGKRRADSNAANKGARQLYNPDDCSILMRRLCNEKIRNQLRRKNRIA